MKKNIELLKVVPMFDNISEVDIDHLLSCLNAKMSVYRKNNIIFMKDEKISKIGIIISGNAQVIKEDSLGNRTILTELSAGDIFGETFVCAGIKKIPVTVLAVTGCEILFVDYKKIMTTCSLACVFHTKLIENMLNILANKNLMLNQKISFISQRTIREKLMSYFAVQIEKSNSNHFTISFTRQELADFLCVDRSALSRELCKMRDENLLKFKGNKFYINLTTI